MQWLNESQAASKEQEDKHFRARPCRVAMCSGGGSGNTANRETTFSVSCLSHPLFGTGEQVGPTHESVLVTQWPFG